MVPFRNDGDRGDTGETLAQVLPEAPLVRLRVRVLRRVYHDGHGALSSTVFCPARLRSLDLDTCQSCPRFSSVSGDCIECAPRSGERLAHDLGLASARLGEDACVGDAMGSFAVAVHADLEAGALARSLEQDGAVVALVVDDAGRLLGLVDVAAAAREAKPVQAHAMARRIQPVHESAPLVHAIDRMVHERARALPVVDAELCVVALLTDLDALRWVARQGPR